jgi:putative molybdopterin biosynthesis protein
MQPPPMPLSDALRRWHEALETSGFPERLDAENVAIADAAGRTPAELLRTKHPSPSYRAAALDGFALRARDTAGAGADQPVSLRVGDACAAIDTGEAIAADFDAVVPLEDAQREGDTIIVRSPTVAGKHVRLPGDDVPPGVAIGWPGIPLRPIDCAVLAAGGCASANVVRRPRLAVIPTGNEVVPVGAPAHAGSVVESNSLMVAGEARSVGAEVTVWPICADDDGAIDAALNAARQDHHVVALIGGSSTGKRDRGWRAIARAGAIDVQRVATRPGRPVVLGHAGRVAIVNLPGYPAACHFAFETYVAPMLRALGGRDDPPARRARIATDVESSGDADEWRTANLLSAPGSPRAIASPIPQIGGGLFRLALADSRFHLKRGSLFAARHTTVAISPLRPQDQSARPLFSGPYDPLIEELAALGGFRCRWTADERGVELDEGIADAVGIIIRDDDMQSLRARAGQRRKVMPVGLRCEGIAYLGARDKAASPDAALRTADQWGAVAAVAAGVVREARCTRYLAERFGLRFEEREWPAYAIVWEERPGHRFPWGIVLPAAIAAVRHAAPSLGWKNVGAEREVNA